MWYLAGHDGGEQILFVGVAQEKTQVWRTRPHRDPVTGKRYPWPWQEQAMVNHRYFYGFDADFGEQICPPMSFDRWGSTVARLTTWSYAVPAPAALLFPREVYKATSHLSEWPLTIRWGIISGMIWVLSSCFQDFRNEPDRITVLGRQLTGKPATTVTRRVGMRYLVSFRHLVMLPCSKVSVPEDQF